MNPWQLDPTLGEMPELYPAYDVTARLLAEEGVLPDFTSDADLRYAHRQLPGTDVYFVANRADKTVEADCAFRVARAAPELWDPLTGETRGLPQFRVADGRTIVPLRFAPDQSFFIVFHPTSPGVPVPVATDRNFPLSRPMSTIEGPWEVSFDTSLGGPARVEFATLDDWSRRPEPGIRYFSGMATYRCTFDVPQTALAEGTRIRLDLGSVHNLARVRVNGTDLGVVWCAPWSLDITDCARLKENRLEIDVANLWPNRLIGDRIVPEEQRVSWTTWNPYQPDSPLLPSGLLGPVTLRSTR